MTRRKCRRNGCQHRTGRGPGTQAASHYLHHSTDCSCHQPQLDDAEPSAPACGRDWCAPGIRFNETGTDGANHCRNLVVTLLAGVMGLLLSVAFAYLGNTLLFAQEFSQTLSPPAVDASILLHGSTFGWALLFCFVLNLLSSGIPAWRASRIGIVNALGGRLHK